MNDELTVHMVGDMTSDVAGMRFGVEGDMESDMASTKDGMANVVIETNTTFVVNINSRYFPLYMIG